MTEKNFIIEAIIKDEQKKSANPDASSKQEKNADLNELKHQLAKWENYVAKGEGYKGVGEQYVEEIKKQLAELGEEIPEENSEEKTGSAKDQTISDSENFTAEYAEEKGKNKIIDTSTKGAESILDSENFTAEYAKEKVKQENVEEKDEGKKETEKNEIAKVDTPKWENAGFAKVNRDNIEDAEFVEVGPQGKQEKGPDRETKITELRKEVEEARKEFLEVDYKKNTALTRVRKFFGGIGKYSEDKKLENDQDIAWYRAQYDNKLFDLQRLLIEDAKEKKSSDKELADMMLEFRTEQKITMASDHDQVKLEQQVGTWSGKIGQGMVGIGKWYNELPLKYKLGASAALLGISLASGGVGLFAGVAVGRRVFGGLTAGVGTRLGLEVRGQKKDQTQVEKERTAFLESLQGLSEKARYDLLEGKIKNEYIKDEKNSIDQIKNQDLRQIGAGAMVGAFLASGWAGDLLRKGIHFGEKEVHELWQHFTGHHNVPTGTGHHGHHAHKVVHHHAQHHAQHHAPKVPEDTITPKPVAEIPPPSPVAETVVDKIPPPPADLPYDTAPEVHINVHISPDHFAGMGHREALHEMRVNMFHHPEHFRHLKDVPVLNEHGKLNIHELHQAGLSGNQHEMIRNFATSHQHPEIRPRGGETFEGWTRRATGVMTRMNPGGGRHR